MKMNRCIVSSVVVLGLGAAQASADVTFHAVGEYDENTYATNTVDDPRDLAVYETLFEGAYANGSGGIVTFDQWTSTTPNANLDLETIESTYNVAYGLGRTLTFSTSNTSGDAVNFKTSSPSSASPISGSAVEGQAPRAFEVVSGGSLTGNDYDITFGGLEDGELLSAVGLTVLSRSGISSTGNNVLVTAFFSGGGSEATPLSIASGAGADDTFVGFLAPTGEGIMSIRIDSPNERFLLIDDLGFQVVVPEPASAALLGLGSLLAIRRRRA